MKKFESTATAGMTAIVFAVVFAEIDASPSGKEKPCSFGVAVMMGVGPFTRLVLDASHPYLRGANRFPNPGQPTRPRCLRGF